MTEPGTAQLVLLSDDPDLAAQLRHLVEPLGLDLTVLDHPLPEASARAQGEAPTAHELRIAAYATQLQASQENLKELYDELEGRTRELQTLASAQQALIPVQDPAAMASAVERGLQALFPTGRVRVEMFPDEQLTGPACTLLNSLGDGAWTRADLPLTAESVPLGQIQVLAPPTGSYPQHSSRVLEMFVSQAAQALHRARLYQALSVGKAEWERTFDTIPDIIAVVGRDLHVRRTNRALADACGLSPREVVGRPFPELLYGADSSRQEECPVVATLHNGEAAALQGGLRRDGRVFDLRAFPLRGADGEVYAAIAYGRDITREEQLTLGLQRSEKLITLGQIAAGIAHEINNPLTAVSSYAQLLQMRLQQSKNAESARRIQEGVERIHNLVRNLMSFARTTDESLYPVNLNAVVDRTLSFIRYEVTRGETELQVQLAPDLPAVLGSEEQLAQLLVNLLTNARDAVGGRGTVVVRTRTDAMQVLLSVEDDGVGIAAADLDQVVEPFYTTKPVGQGTGLGLFIAAGIAEKHSGRLRIESHPGQGTRATLELPAFEA